MERQNVQALRNFADYEMMGIVSEQELKEMVILASELHDMTTEWLKKNYPELT